MAFAIIFFASGKAPFRLTLRAGIRHPTQLYYVLLTELVHILTLSRLGHVAIGSNSHVLNMTMTGQRIWPIDTYLSKYPGLKHAYVVPVRAAFQVALYPSDRRIKAMPSIIKWLTCGKVRTGDCVCSVRDILKELGVCTPDSCYTPARLDRWLARRFERAEMG